MCMKWVVLGNAGMKPVGVGTVPSLQDSLTLPLDLSGWGGSTDRNGGCRYVWMDGNSSVPLSPSQFW